MKKLVSLILVSLFSIVGFTQMASVILQQTDVTCNGQCDGTAMIATTGGQPPYIISGPFSSSPQTYSSVIPLAGICAGTYTLLVEDALGATNVVVITITEPAVLSVSSTPTDESSVGACDGSITAIGGGGTPGYAYSLNNGTFQSSGTFSGLCAGTYQVCVEDAHGCVSCDPLVVVGTGTTPDCSGFAATLIQQTNISCNGACDGSVLIAATGAQLPYTVSGTFTASPQTFTSVGTLGYFCAGVDVLTVTSADGCTYPLTVNFTEPTALTTSFSVSDESSSGACDGSITSTVSGGTAGYTFTLNGINGQSSPTYSGLCAGTYEVCVIDANGCSSCDPNLVVASSSAPDCSGFAATLMQQTNISCNGACDGSVLIAATGAQLPYTVSGTFTASPQTFTSVGTLGYFCAGVDVLTVTSADGCTYPLTVNFTEPAALTSSFIATNESSSGACDGSITTSATGGTSPYTYTLNGSSSSFTNLCAGTYQVCVTDANGCGSCDLFVTVGTGTTPNCSGFVASLMQQTNITCNGDCNGSILITATGAQMPYIVSGNFTGSPQTFTTVGSLGYFCAGLDILTVTSADGCTYPLTVNFTEPTELVATASLVSAPTSSTSCDGVLTGTATGGTLGSGYIYEWIDCSTMTSIDTQPTTSGRCEGDYALVVHDANGCTDTTACITLSASSGAKEISNADVQIYPNPVENILNIQMNQWTSESYLEIMDLQGKVILQRNITSDSFSIPMDTNLGNGIYLLRLHTPSKTVTKRIEVLR